MKIENLQEGVRVDGIYNDTEYPTLVIEAEYELGGYNYFSGGIGGRGVYVYFERMEFKDGFKSFTPFNDTNFKVLALELKRKSQKKIDAVISWVQKNAEELANLYVDDKRQEIVEMLKNIM